MNFSEVYAISSRCRKISGSMIRGDSKRTSGFFLFDKEKFIEKLGL